MGKVVLDRNIGVFQVHIFFKVIVITDYETVHAQVVNRKNQGYGLPADIWSLGCTVLEMLTRLIPYSHLECVSSTLFQSFLLIGYFTTTIYILFCYANASVGLLVNFGSRWGLVQFSEFFLFTILFDAFI